MSAARAYDHLFEIEVDVDVDDAVEVEPEDIIEAVDAPRTSGVFRTPHAAARVAPYVTFKSLLWK